MIDKLLNKHGDVIPGSENYEPKQTHVDMFKRLAAQPDDTRGMGRPLLIMSTPRCGSTLFCEVLNNTRQLGLADEWLNYEYFATWTFVLGHTHFDLQEYINWIARKTLRNTGVMVINWHIGQIIAMNDDFGLGLNSLDFKKIVYLSRRDKIAQAVSLAKAASTNQFRSYEKATEVADLSFPAIVKALKSITDFDTFAHTTLREYIDFEWSYEDFRRTGDEAYLPHECYETILKEFGGQPQLTYNTGNLKKQGDDTNKRAATRFLKYITGESPYENR
jgi:LPS sulfotransferase NodH